MTAEPYRRADPADVEPPMPALVLKYDTAPALDPPAVDAILAQWRAQGWTD